MILQALEKNFAQKWAKNELSSNPDTLVGYDPFCWKLCLGNVLALLNQVLTINKEKIENLKKILNFSKKSSKFGQKWHFSLYSLKGLDFDGKQTNSKKNAKNINFESIRQVSIPQTIKCIKNW